MSSIFDPPFLLLFFFLMTSAGILWLSFLFTESIKGILNSFRLSENFVGSSLLATGTSLAEAINAITAGFYDRDSSQNNSNGIKYSLDSFYNLTGAISIQLVFLSMVAMIQKRKFQKTYISQLEYSNFACSIFHDKTTLWAISTIELSILTVCFIFPDISKHMKIGTWNLIPFLFFLFWALYLLLSKKTNLNNQSLSAQNYTNMFQKYNNKKFLCLVVLIFVAFSLLAFFNFNLVAKFEKVFYLPKNMGLGTILSLMTSFPEFASFAFLFSSKCYQTACAGFLGSALFNLVLPVMTQSIKGNWLFESISTNSQEQLSLVIWLLSIVLINMFFYLGFSFTGNKAMHALSKREYRKINVWGYSVMATYLLASFVMPMFFQRPNAKITQ